MRLASFNVENLFDRAKAMNLDTWAEGRVVLDQFAELEKLLGQVIYSDADKARMATLIVELGMEKSDTGPFVILRRNRGNLLKRPTAGGIVIIANGRIDWVGSLELRDEPINEVAMQNTARVMSDLEADILGVVEVESRPVLTAFNTQVLPAVGGNPFTQVMVIDGNDERGIDVGLVTRRGFTLDIMRSHVDDRDAAGNPIFSRDCPEYYVTTPGGTTLLVMVNHFKSKGFGSAQSSDARRHAQAQRAREIYDKRIADGLEHIALIGDLNDIPDSAPLAPLKASTLRDAFTHSAFDDGGFPGTFGLANAGNKIDYLFLSPKLFERVERGGVFRKGAWPGSRPKRWETYPELTEPKHAASDHAAIWVDLNI
ncbi:endonuclease/exonuclease/phosphatase family metal-dependent hydrolase [Rhizobium mesoamericanum]|uniref:endonuclease/exonuclease/phosphatase family protein n=1 Tax=Rhizobium mesoamericanum TaxID=1079800 RepID=UPI002787760F|nr:endonuclease/exonuclease/phosphatase family protein [Rhizobium mesoamericanum]MDQ0563086.1 endonuclease/exonuclease/phosphatase family metal-dependent hydrolase [Rhizobium mesoamericanum]